MGGNKLKRISKNFISSELPKKRFCPICISRNEEIVMVRSEMTKSMVCKNCGYDTPLNMEPIIDTELEAGNAPDTSKPYLKTVSFSRNRSIKDIPDKYNTAMDAWQAEP